MRISGDGLIRQIVGCLVLSLLAPLVSAAVLPSQDQNAGDPAGSSAPAQSPGSNNLPQKGNPGQPQPQPLPNSPGSARSQTAQNNSQFSAQQPPSRDQQAQEPVGTAAAGSVETTGVAASKPAGAAIAPAKQRRTRAFLIKVSALVGATVAVGTVVALANASPSRPPGAR
jgi:hypothetical protein